MGFSHFYPQPPTLYLFISVLSTMVNTSPINIKNSRKLAHFYTVYPQLRTIKKNPTKRGCCLKWPYKTTIKPVLNLILELA